MTAAELAARIPGAKKHGKRYRAICPAHDDKNPSMYWFDGETQVIVGCSVCSSREVVKALKELGYWPEQVNRLTPEQIRARQLEKEMARYWRRGKLNMLDKVLAECTREIDKAAAKNHDPTIGRQKVCRETTALRLALLDGTEHELLRLYRSDRETKPKMAGSCIQFGVAWYKAAREVIEEHLA